MLVTKETGIKRDNGAESDEFRLIYANDMFIQTVNRP